MSEQSGGGFMRTIIFFILAVPMIWYLVSFSIKKNNQFEGKAKLCAETCSAQGYLGSEFKWSAFSKEDCHCIEGE